ncbi:MAG: Rrf2 family transcriptional regulator [Armatimonadetes bacterium]|nr:Rrf2 family transcriptional regulator [Armatimonadota bacterium]
MKLSAQEEYGIRCLITLANKGEDASMTIPEISEIEGMTPSHVAKILAILRRAGIVESTRGQAGGYKMARQPKDIVLKTILDPLGGQIFGPDFCERFMGGHEECVHEGNCNIRPLWTSIQAAVDAVTTRYTLEDIMQGRIEEPLVKVALQSPRN